MEEIEVMKSSSIKNHERFLRWEKAKVNRAVQMKIIERAGEITEKLLQIGFEQENPNVLNSLLDRAFGKARQNIGLDGGAEDKPIVFMPSVLMEKYQIKSAEYTEIKGEEGEDPVAMVQTPIDDDGLTR